MKSEQIKEITDRATEQLVAALKSGHSQALTAYLKAIGRFHRYSLNNVLLIALQKPHASYVAGFRTWNELGRFVRKCEKGIMILAPIVRRKVEDEETADEASRAIGGFRAAYVFDISQTDGKDLPQIGIVQGDPRGHCDRLRQFAIAQGIAVEYSQEIAPARGTSFGGRIALLPGQPRRKNSRRWRMKSRTNFSIVATVARARPNESARPKPKQRHSLSVVVLDLKPDQRQATTSSFGMAMHSYSLKVLATSGRRHHK